jgi:hypothetical protein
MSPSSTPSAARTLNRIFALLIALTTVVVFAVASGGTDPQFASAHHRPGHEGGPEAEATSVSPQPTPVSPQPTPTSVSPQPTPTPGPTSTPGPTKTPLAEGERPGWGCGDDNHEHVGPPGNPDAESPCDKNDSAAAASASDEHRSDDDHGDRKSGKGDED